MGKVPADQRAAHAARELVTGNGVCLPWLRSAAGATTQRACGSNTQRSAKPPSTRRPQLACSVPKAAPSTAAGALVTLASARIGPGPPGAWPHFNASGSSSGQHASSRRWIDAHPPMHLIGGDDAMAL